jgi:hypothetical protein
MQRLDALNERYGPGYMVLLACLSRHDPWDLIPMCPPDEYAHEAAAIWKRLPETNSEEELAQIMLETFRVNPDTTWAGEAWIDERVEQFARDFWHQWQQFKTHPYQPKWRHGPASHPQSRRNR